MQSKRKVFALINMHFPFDARSVVCCFTSEIKKKKLIIYIAIVKHAIELFYICTVHLQSGVVLDYNMCISSIIYAQAMPSRTEEI